MRFVLYASIACLVVALAYAAVLGCAPAASRKAAGDAYEAALVRCALDSETLAESRACRARVDAQWHVVRTWDGDAGLVADGGRHD